MIWNHRRKFDLEVISNRNYVLQKQWTNQTLFSHSFHFPSKSKIIFYTSIYLIAIRNNSQSTEPINSKIKRRCILTLHPWSEWSFKMLTKDVYKLFNWLIINNSYRYYEYLVWVFMESWNYIYISNEKIPRSHKSNFAHKSNSYRKNESCKPNHRISSFFKNNIHFTHLPRITSSSAFTYWWCGGGGETAVQKKQTMRYFSREPD